MVAEIELTEKESSTAEAKRIIGKKLAGKNITKKRNRIFKQVRY